MIKLERLKHKRSYYIWSLIILITSILVSNIGYDGYQFPHSSLSNLGNPNNHMYMFFNFGLILSVFFLSVYIRYITLKLFKNSNILRISYIIPVISAMFIGFFPQYEGREIHSMIVIGNVILLTILTPINVVGLWRRSKMLLLTLTSVAMIFLNAIGVILLTIPFDFKRLGVLELTIVGLIFSICIILDIFHSKRKKPLSLKK